ncbi:MAG TPA: hypothetical protein VIH42_02790, partial [Thermoguttaceae bacterium]
AITLKPLPGTTRALTEAELRDLAKNGILKRVGKNLPNSIVRTASKEAFEQMAKTGGKVGAKAIAKAILRKIPVVLIIFAAEDYAEGGVEKAAKNLVIPGELIEDVAREASSRYDQWFEEALRRRHRNLYGRFGDLPEFPEYRTP